MRSTGEDHVPAAGPTAGFTVLVGLVLGGLALIEIWVQPIFQTGIPGPRVPLTVLVAIMVTALASHERWPLAGAAAFSGTVVAIGWVGQEDQSAFELALGSLVVAYTLAKTTAGPRAWIGAGLLFGGFLGWFWLTYTADDRPDDFVVPALLISAAWYVGREVRHHRQRAASVAAASVEEERSRIARELHDVVAHGVSVMGLQASSARAGLPPELVDQRATLEAIESLGRATLEELHRMLGVLRSGTDHAAPVQPLPRLDQLANLCAGSGTPPVVRLSVEGHPRNLSTGLELSAYRIVQEALTNVRRHANAEVAWVRLNYLPDTLNIEVADDGDGSANPVRFGHGLVGIRERVALHGGSLVVDPTAHGYRVQVVLPTGGDT
ncbi:sensor histidine kinase [Nocardioides bizhenqiangii]|uniref:histidine kinase n=1 Tax=Nocardioides bizhenqiangii TaxID=3095076 RepID=A0ABZ0ZML8_9ACTN|nr:MULTISPECIES: histidine kinase [unclassified Nocardioides]MDZ5621610.1 histidine kinase [Nocardioides sp. HM23]WQQ25554.1 histidine kinase [Nocardioides sp. HM61]